MLMVQTIGVVCTAIGLYLFARSQLSGVPSGGEAGIDTLGVSVKAPPDIMLIVIGLVVIGFTFSPWWPGDDEPVAAPAPTTATVLAPTPTTTTSPSTTLTPFDPVVQLPPDAPVVDDFFPGDPEAWPLPPVNIRLAEPDDYQCDSTPTLLWDQSESEYVDWYLVVDIYFGIDYQTTIEVDSFYDEWTLGYDFSGQPYPGWCLWSDYDSQFAYVVFVYAYNDAGWSEAAMMQIFP